MVFPLRNIYYHHKHHPKFPIIPTYFALILFMFPTQLKADDNIAYYIYFRLEEDR